MPRMSVYGGAGSQAASVRLASLDAMLLLAEARQLAEELVARLGAVL